MRGSARARVVMVVVYKPEFVAHDGGAPIFSVDAAPDGTRFATAGGDQKVKVWALASALEREVEADEGAPKCLATLSDHFGPVNCVRFSKNGRYLASGSTDTSVLVYALRDGPGKSVFGSTDAPNVENWTIAATYRGHSSDVIDIAWSPDDSMLATCSLDNLVVIWDCRTGNQITTLRGHTSFVKGVAWDPIGKFLATQSDDKTCIIWRTDDWTQVAKVEEPYQASMGATFSMRLCWSPDGKAVTTCNAYKKPSHTAAALERGTWGDNFNFVGHKGPVVAVRFSPVLFQDQQREKLHTVIACGSQDCKLTIWTTNRPKPVCIVRKCFSQSVVDLCWTPDGYTLLACSTDGTLCTFTFDRAEIGDKLDDAAAEAFLSETYGDIRRNRAPMLEDPTLLGFEAPREFDDLANKTQSTPPPPKRIQPAPIRSKNGNTQTSVATISAQRETISNDGRRRIVPVAATGPSAGTPVKAPQRIQLQPLPTNTQPEHQPSGQANGLKRRIEPTAVNGGDGFQSSLDQPTAKRVTLQPTQIQQTPPAVAAAPSAAPRQQIATTALGAPAPLPVAPPPGTLHVQLVAPDLDAEENSEDRAPLLLEAKNQERAVELVCSKAGKIKWTDRIDRRATHASGNKYFSAVAFEDGSLQLYTPSGRRYMPTLLLPDSAAFVVSGQDDASLLIVTRDYKLLVWNVTPGKETCALQADCSALVRTSGRSGVALSQVRLSKSGAPIFTFTNGHAYVYHSGLKTWARVADQSFLRSEFTSRIRQPGSSGVGEVQALQIGAARAAAHMGPSALLQSSGQTAGRETGRHLEVLISGASILSSTSEYRPWLAAYVRHLANECGDDPRTAFVGAEPQLREICAEFLGPLSATTSVDTWESEILGEKKRTLLREVIIPTIAANRSAQRFVSEVVELLQAAEAREKEAI